MAAPQQSQQPPVRVDLAPEGDTVVLSLQGHLDTHSLATVWSQAVSGAADAAPTRLVVDGTGVEYCDGGGASLIVTLRLQQEARGGSFELRGLRDEFQELVRMISPGEREPEEHGEDELGFFASLGRESLGLVSDMRELVTFVGELLVSLLLALRNPAQVRWSDVLVIAQRAGNGAIPIIVLIGFLLGVILSFQSAIPMRQFGAEIFVADLLAISLLRELGPLMAAIMVAARSGSAFAAEIGTMKVNEEIDALSTMGLTAVRFLIVPRVIAAFIVIPSLIMLMNLSGLLGGALVMNSLGFSMVTYVDRISAAAGVGDLMGGLFKGFVFSIIVAAVGCMRGLQTGQGAGAVGESTTSSVVSGIILIAVMDGLFAVVFFVLGW